MRARPLHGGARIMRVLLVSSVLALSSLVGCMDSSTEADELAAEEAADGTLGGKADGNELWYGKYQALEVDYDDGEPLVAVFQPPVGPIREGESGFVDLSRYDDDYDTEHMSGTFKLYRYAGRDRIRIADSTGRVLLRADWSSEGDSVLTIAGEEMVRSTTLESSVLDCYAMDIFDGEAFEEGLSATEYPDVSIDREDNSFSLSIGASSFSLDEETSVEVRDNADVIEATATSGDVKYIIRVPNTTPLRGEVLWVVDGETESSIADIACVQR